MRQRSLQKGRQGDPGPHTTGLLQWGQETTLSTSDRVRRDQGRLIRGQLLCLVTIVLVANSAEKIK
jgi:hypothetical protein